MDEKFRVLDYIDSKSDSLAEMTSEFIRTPSISGSEGAVAKILMDVLTDAGIDTKMDFAGNVVGAMEGNSSFVELHQPREHKSRQRKKLTFNVHLDTVPAGLPDSWENDPFSGIVKDGKIYGRGASDTKGAWAPMILAMEAVMKNGGVEGDVFFTAVVMEELTYCIGMRTLLESTLKDAMPDYIISGEATSLNVAIGHRGRTELELTLHGRSCHASTPWRGENALYKAGKIIAAIESLSEDLTEEPGHPLLGKSSLSLTHMESMPGGHNVVPDLCRMYLDYRFLPRETLETIVAKVKQKLDSDADVRVGGSSEVTYTGHRFSGQKYVPAFAIDRRHPLVRKVEDAAEKILPHPPKVQHWDFTTDGGYSMGVLGIPTIGFSPCEEQLAHTVDEYVRIGYMIKAAKIYAMMILGLCGSGQK